MPAAGVFGYGEAYRDLVEYERLGAVVTHPVSLRSRRAAHGPRFAAHGEQLLVHTGLPNAGLKRVLREQSALWARLPVPVILHLLATTPDEVARASERLVGARNVLGIELGLDDGTPAGEALALLDAARAGGLPVVVRLPFDGVERLALPLADAGADALTLTAPPRARLPLAGSEELLQGRLYGRALLPLLLHRLATWAPHLSVPLIAAGGIATPEEARACLDLGATALQIDALLWQNPRLITDIAKELET
jgi:dihydroorotate dehydrogenase